MELAKFEFSDPDLLSDEEIAEILAKADHLVSCAYGVTKWPLLRP